ncbi:hypothetical protein [Paucibacter sp. TC2R-5]|uniref:hypothetical protein n=1 Tax=Paucibacter sp. TC2R-5 TaxID=2893555 RepID=UPI0021E3F52E|nr:hypothetical protein [Paucibacter sp. TC2R-5]
MQVHQIDKQQLSDTLQQSEILSQLEGIGSTTYLLRYQGQDILIHHEHGEEQAGLIYQDSSQLPEGGSLHDQARAARAARAAMREDRVVVCAP